jgi:CRISPR-associated endonuclease Csn1
VIACVTPGIVHKITKYTQAREIAKSKGLVMIDEETGEVFDPKEYTNNEWDAMFGVKPPLPWSAFKDEIIIRTGKKPLEFILANRKVNYELNYPEWMMNENVIKEIFVSRMPRHKNTGSVHDATIRSPKIFDEGYVISKVPLSKLKLKAGEIENYYNPESDLLLYNALKERLIKYENDSEKAFAEPMYKPKSDGSRGPLVKRVKVVSKMTLGVPAASGIAANGDMIRIDIFCENGKYYMVPIYVADTVKKELPNRAVVANKPLTQWKIMNESDFVFSLYPNDLIMVAKKGGIKVTNNQGQKEEKTDKIFVYYNSADISTGSIKFSSDDKEYSGKGLGIQSLQCFKKYTVDVLGNIQLVNKERRCDFR